MSTDRDWYDDLVRDLKSQDGETRRLALKNLGERSGSLGAEEKATVAELVQELLSSDNWQPVKMWAAWILGLLRQPSAFPQLVSALTDENRDVRCHAALALGKLRDERAVAALEKFIAEETDSLTSSYGIRALGHFARVPQRQDARDALLSLRNDESTPPELRGVADEQLTGDTARMDADHVSVQMTMLDDITPGESPPPNWPPDGVVRRELRVTTVPPRDRRAKEAHKKSMKAICQICGEPPFEARGGGGFCEVHHIVPLRSGGPDGPPNLLAVCPNCHKKLHYARSVKYEPDPREKRARSVTINGVAFDIDWRDRTSRAQDTNPQ